MRHVAAIQGQAPRFGKEVATALAQIHAACLPKKVITVRPGPIESNGQMSIACFGMNGVQLTSIYATMDQSVATLQLELAQRLSISENSLHLITGDARSLCARDTLAAIASPHLASE